MSIKFKIKLLKYFILSIERFKYFLDYINTHGVDL